MRLLLIFFLLTGLQLGAQVTQMRPGLQAVTNGDNKMKVNDFYGAYQEYSTAIAVDPTFADAYYKRSLVLIKLERMNEALADQDKALQLNPRIAGLYDTRAQLKMLVEDYPGAIEDLSRAIEENPARLQLYDALAQAHLASGNFESAIEGYNTLLRNNPDDTLGYVLRAITYLNSGNIDAARKDIAKALELNENHVLAQDVQGLIFLKEQRYREAIDAFDRVISSNPQIHLAHYNRGVARRLMGDLEGALKDFDKAVELEQDFSKNSLTRNFAEVISGTAVEIPEPDRDYTEALFFRGLTRKLLGDYQGALQDFDEAIRLNSKDPEAYNNRGNIRMLFGDYPRAIEDYSQAIRLNEDYAIAYFNRAIAKLMLMRRKDSCEDFRSSLRLGYESAASALEDFCTNP